MRQQHSCISHGSNVEQNALRSWHATMYEFVTSMVLCGLGMQQCAMHNETIQKTTSFELGVYLIIPGQHIPDYSLALLMSMSSPFHSSLKVTKSLHETEAKVELAQLEKWK